jgi:hypothetical protein
VDAQMPTDNPDYDPDWKPQPQAPLRRPRAAAKPYTHPD